MQASYSQLIADHDKIEASANLLLVDLEDDTLSPAELAAQVGELAFIVNEHIEVEDAILDGVDSAALAAPWTEAWREGEAAFLKLRTDWIAFLERWTASTIAADRAGFSEAATAILGRLRDRLAIETKAFYATALQTGGISLR